MLHFPLFSQFKYIVSLFLDNYYFPLRFQISSWFRKMYVFWHIFCVFRFPLVWPWCIYASHNARARRSWRQPKILKRLDIRQTFILYWLNAVIKYYNKIGAPYYGQKKNNGWLNRCCWRDRQHYRRQHVQRHYEKNGTKSHRCKLHKRNWRRPWRIDISMRGLGLSIWGRSWMRRLLLQLSWGRNSTGSWVNLTTTILSYTGWSLLSLLKLPYVALAFKKSLKDLFKWTKCFEVFTRNSRRIQLLRSLSVALAACLP